jgi:phage gpG-like protein
MNPRAPHPFSAAAKQFRAMMTRLPSDVSVIGEREVRENFRRQGYLTESGTLKNWRKRKVNRTRRDNGRGILIRSGKLMRGNRASPLPGIARVVNSVPYAKFHNDGFEGEVKVKAHKRNLFSRSMEKRKNRMQTITKKTGTVEVRAHTKKLNMPARPFMVVPDESIQKHIERELEKIWLRA